MGKPAQYDYEGIYEAYLNDRTLDGKEVGPQYLSDKFGVPMRTLAGYMQRHDWVRRRKEHFKTVGFYGKPAMLETPEKPADDEPDPIVIDPMSRAVIQQAVAQGNTLTCPHCGHQIYSIDDAVVKLAILVPEMLEKVQARIRGLGSDSSSQQYKQLTDTLAQVMRLLETTNIKHEQMMADMQGDVLSGAELSEVKRLAQILLQMLKEAPPDDLEVIELRDALEDVVHAE